jgi:hypothetical protein
MTGPGRSNRNGREKINGETAKWQPHTPHPVKKGDWNGKV